jgi:hypothetical protein
MSFMAIALFCLRGYSRRSVITILNYSETFAWKVSAMEFSWCLRVETILALKVEPSKIMYSKVLAALCRAGDMEKAQWFFDVVVA